MLHIYTPFKCTDWQTHSLAQWFFDACRYRCVMMSYGREQGREAWSKERGRDEGAGEDIQDNNGTKMATASAMGRPLASRPPNRPEEPWTRSKYIHSPYSQKMTTSMRNWNYQANLSHHYRWASTVSSPSTLAFPPLPLNHQTLKHPDVWLPSLYPKHLSWVAILSNNTFSSHFLSFSQPFHHGLLAVNIGLSLPSKAAHQLPWLPSVCVRVKERKGERGKKKNTMYQRSRNAFMPDFGLGWVLLSIIFPSCFFSQF